MRSPLPVHCHLSIKDRGEDHYPRETLISVSLFCLPYGVVNQQEVLLLSPSAITTLSARKDHSREGLLASTCTLFGAIQIDFKAAETPSSLNIIDIFSK